MRWNRLLSLASRRTPRLLLAATLVASLLSVVVIAVEPAPRSEAVVSCGENVVYTIDQATNQLNTFSSSTGATQSVGTIDTATAPTVNAIAVPAGGGQYLYGFSRTATAPGVIRYDIDANTVTVTPAPVVTRPEAVIAGSFDPTSGRYWFAHAESSPSTTWTAYSYDPSSSSAPRREGQITGLTGGSGDFAFDHLGNMYLISGNGTTSGALWRVNTSTLTPTKLVDLPAPTAQYAAVAFDSVGRIVINAGTGTMSTYDPGNGSLLETHTLTPSTGGQSDYASCLFPNTMRGYVNLPNGRFGSGDQFRVHIDNGGSTASTTGTTTGTDSGLQNAAGEVAGPTLGTDGSTYQVSLVAASGADLTNYNVTWTCRDVRHDQTLGSGNGANGSFTVPVSGDYSDVICTYDVVPKSTLQVVGQISGTRVAPSDQVTVAMNGTGLTGTPQSATTSGTGSSAQTGVIFAQAGESYTVTAQLASGSASTLADYTQSISCVDTRDNSAITATAGSAGTWTTPALQAGQQVRCTVVTTARPPGLDLVKTGDTVTGPTVDGSYTVRHTVTVTNTGPAAATYGPLTDTPSFASNLAVTGQSWTTSGGAPAGGTGSGPSTLAPSSTSIAKGATHTYVVSTTFQYTNRTQALACNGSAGRGLYNAASLPTGQQTTTTSDDTACVAPPTPPAPSISLDKQAGPLVDAASPTGPSAGDTIDYTYVVQNTGNQNLSSVTIDDPKVGPVSCPVSTLAPGASTTCTATYTLTQDDVNAGGVDGAATVTGTPPTGAVVTASDSTSTPVARTAALSLDKTAGSVTEASAPAGASAGDTITFSFAATNTGNVPLTGVTVTDPKVGTVTCPGGALQPGMVRTCDPVTYSITQADVESGSVNNTASAGATPPSGVPAPTAAGDSTSTAIESAPAVTVDKSHGPIVDAAAPVGASAGDTVTFSYVVTNTGNRPLSDIGVVDPSVGGPVSCPQATLQPLESMTCTVTYTLTQADLDAGQTGGTATATGTPPAGADVQATDSDTVVVPRSAGYTLDKVAGSAVSAGRPGPVDDTIAYSFVFTNTGTTTLDGLEVSDAKVGTVTCPDGAIAPGDQATCTAAAYTITQADVDAGTVDNTATGSADAPSGVTPAADPQDSTSTSLAPTQGLELAKSSDPTSAPAAGTEITYTYVVTNTGQVTIDDVRVADPLPGLSPITCTPPQGSSLAPGATMTCTATYTTTQADADAGRVPDSTATASGENPSGTPVEDTASSDVLVPPAPAIELDKSASPISEEFGPEGPSQGDTITYDFTVRNAGNVTLTDVTVTDPMLGAVECPAGPLAPGETFDCNADPYALTQDDVEAGSVQNTATATGEPPSGDAVSTTDSTSTSIESGPAILLDKSHEELQDVAEPAGPSAGDTVAYTFAVTNIGNRVLSDVGVDDPKAGAVTCADTTLAPGATTTCETVEPYAVTQDEIDAGLVENTATATGAPAATAQDPNPETVTADDTDELTVEGSASVTLDKVAGQIEDVVAPEGPSAGDTIRFDFVVTNTGTVTLDRITIDDPMVGAVECPTASLAPGATTDCTPVTYEMTQDDVDAGSVDNDASVSAHPVGSGPDGAIVNADDSTSSTLERDAALALVKTAELTDGDGDGSADAGEVITYSFAVTNTGNVRVTDVVVNDPMLDVAGVAIDCPVQVLDPGDTLTCTAGAYTVTPADVETGEVRNTANASADSPSGPVGSPADEVVTPIDQPAPATTPTATVPFLPNAGGASFLLLLAALTALLSGGLLVLVARRRDVEV